MHIRFIRNATLLIVTETHQILVDPMLGKKGSLPPLTLIRHAPRRNPLVDLPSGTMNQLTAVTIALITHCRFGHNDHLDNPGSRFLAQRQIPTYCSHLDNHYLQRRGIQTIPLQPNKAHPLGNGRITPIPTQHGYGFVGKLMGPGVGYIINLPNEPTLYISGDTVLTPIVKQALTTYKPDIAVIAAGSAQLDVGQPILMPIAEMIEFLRLAPGKVIATHMEALNHCPTTRSQLQTAVSNANLSHKLLIPEDGETLTSSLT